MYLPDWVKKFILNDSIFFAILIVLIGVTSFGLGRWSITNQTINRQTASVIMSKSPENTGTTTGNLNSNKISGKNTKAFGKYVASKNGSKYHLPQCPGAKQMKAENKIWFSNKSEAEKAGYTPAGNCKGI